MKKISIADTTLCRGSRAFSFREKLEIARLLVRLEADVIELPQIENPKTDILLVRTIGAFLGMTVLSVAAGSDKQSILDAAEALSAAAKRRIRIELPVSPACMEYSCHRKPQKMLEWIGEAVKIAADKCDDVEFCAADATRAERGFLADAIKAALDNGAGTITLCDDASVMLPDDFADFAAEISAGCGTPVGVRCTNGTDLACAQSVLAVKKGANAVKTSVGGDVTPLESFAAVLKNCGNSYGISSSLRSTELNRVVKQIVRITDGVHSAGAPAVAADDAIQLDGKDDRSEVILAIQKLGYDLSEEDQQKVYEEFCRVAAKKKVGAKELDAIVASAALQVPATYKLESYVVNNGNIIDTTAQITVLKGDERLRGLSCGDGPIDAAFLAIEQIIGRHYDLDDFQIQSVTEGKEAVGSALVKLRSDGRIYSGNGVSTDIISAAIRAYLSAVNKIAYEEA